MHDHPSAPAHDLADSLVIAGLDAALPAATPAPQRFNLRIIANLIARHRIDRQGRASVTAGLRAALGSRLGRALLAKLGKGAR